jgi:hypothetical protein
MRCSPKIKRCRSSMRRWRSEQTARVGVERAPHRAGSKQENRWRYVLEDDRRAQKQKLRSAGRRSHEYWQLSSIRK